MKRIGLFLLTNAAIVLVLGIVLRLLGVEQMMMGSGSGLNLTSLLVFAAVFGMGGSFISLAMSKWMAKRSTGARVIEAPASESERWLVDTVRGHADRAGLGMPEVAVYDAPEPNAFATGMSKNSSLVAVSTGLLQRMNSDEVDGVLAHEVSHIANGDMVTLALLQGVLNTFVIFLSRIVGHFVDRAVFRSQNGHGPGFWITTIVTEMLFGILASIIVAWFSRYREFRADAGAAELAGTAKMVGALERLKSAHEPVQLPDGMQAFGIRGGGGGALRKLLASHPPLDDRIAALRAAGR